MRRRKAAWLALGLTFALAAEAAEIRVGNGWARPPAGAVANAPAHVDIESDTALTLTGATSPRAASVAIVVVASTDLDAARRDATELAIPARRATRLAPRGPFLELRGFAGTVTNGERVPLTLEFVDAQGLRQRVETTVEIRGTKFGPAKSPVPADDAGLPVATQAPPGR